MRRVQPAALVLTLAVAACASTPDDDELAVMQAAEPAAIIAASAAERAAIAQMNPLQRATFWNEQYELNPADREAAAELSRALRQIGNPDRAAQIAEQGLAMHPDDAELLIAFASARIDEGRAPAAIEPLTRAAAAAPDDWRPWSIMGVAHDQLEEFTIAKARYQRALSLKPGDPVILSNLAMSYLLEGDLDQAETLLRQATSTGGATPPQARQNLALVLALKGQFEEAERLALIDLPAGTAEANIEYIRAMMSSQRRWDDLRDGG